MLRNSIYISRIMISFLFSLELFPNTNTHIIKLISGDSVAVPTSLLSSLEVINYNFHIVNLKSLISQLSLGQS